MKAADITLESLLAAPDIRAIYYETQWYFSYDDLNGGFDGIFKNAETLTFPVEDGGHDYNDNFVSCSDVFLCLQTIDPD